MVVTQAEDIKTSFNLILLFVIGIDGNVTFDYLSRNARLITDGSEPTLFGNLQVQYQSRWVYVCGVGYFGGLNVTLLHYLNTLVCPHIRRTMSSPSPVDHQYRSHDEYEFLLGNGDHILTYKDQVNGPCQRKTWVNNITLNCLRGKKIFSINIFRRLE